MPESKLIKRLKKELSDSKANFFERSCPDWMSMITNPVITEASEVLVYEIDRSDRNRLTGFFFSVTLSHKQQNPVLISGESEDEKMDSSWKGGIRFQRSQTIHMQYLRFLVQASMYLTSLNRSRQGGSMGDFL